MAESWVFVEGSKKFFLTPMHSSPLAIIRAMSVGASKRKLFSGTIHSFVVTDTTALGII